jgi:hypothetical protein
LTLGSEAKLSTSNFFTPLNVNSWDLLGLGRVGGENFHFFFSLFAAVMKFWSVKFSRFLTRKILIIIAAAARKLFVRVNWILEKTKTRER